MDISFIPTPIIRFSARMFFSLPESIKRKIAGKPITINGNILDVDHQIICKFFGMPKNITTSVKNTRKYYDDSGSLLGHSINSDVIKTNFTVKGSECDIPCEKYQPKILEGNELKVLIYFHGGGHVIGSLKSHRLACSQLALEANCVVIAVDYRLSPDYKFPAGIIDALDVYDYVVNNAKTLGINPNKIAIGGESAGGNIAAVIAQQRKESTHPPYFQLLIVPWLDMSKQSNSYQQFESGFFLDKVTMEWYTNNYINTPEDSLNPMVSPLFGDLNNVCEAAVIVVGFDPLRDEGLVYVNKLKEANIPVTFVDFKTIIHPFMNFAGIVKEAQKAFEKIAEILKNKLYSEN